MKTTAKSTKENMGRIVVSARLVLRINFGFGGMKTLRKAPRFLAAVLQPQTRVHRPYTGLIGVQIAVRLERQHR
ncbi:hypothetical protein SAMN00777080_2590 [Aquiflexum balticum DSM 16537]|uniref:Uncharacterized protein n=1 Tax=Aquiflexum balticum DSM 16537 TaxID=758820 RepID=A0A1W2H648_9BACT|nr:hypothetical protein [Aquiflexum balticum]SMD43976.1 hypothetical protein SAMN00777080_2590 [Aquiflexum balticum DSM 16537]